MVVFRTIRMIGGFESHTDDNTKQPVKDDICQTVCDLATAQPFSSFDSVLLFKLNKDGHVSS